VWNISSLRLSSVPPVRLVKSLLFGLSESDLNTLVEIYKQPGIAYDVEFINRDGSTRALLTLAPGQLQRLSPADVITTRQIALAA
jgi:hypothetical protein